jgi:diguanylate cyclase (GGDEF)-like protein
MKPTVFTLFRFIIALLTVMAIAGKPYVPPKTLQIYPAANTLSSIYGPNATTSWINQDRNEWRCDHQPGTEVCGLTLSWDNCWAPSQSFCQDASENNGAKTSNNETCTTTNSHASSGNSSPNIVPLSACPTIGPLNEILNETLSEAPNETLNKTLNEEKKNHNLPQSVDFSRYEGMKVKIYYEGKAKFLRLYLRNHDDPSRTADEQKFMSAFLRAEDLKDGETYVSLSELSVAEWWVRDANVPRKLASPQFDQIVTVGIDNIEYGVHRMRLESVELTGERISTEKLLIALLLFWSGYLLLEAGVRYYYLRKSSHHREAKINQLTHQAQKLEQEKNILRTLAITDPLTMALNRAGLQQKIMTWSATPELPVNTGLLIIDIDHFKKINDTHGHDIGDRTLKSLVELIEENIRDGDIFGRWGGEEFLLVTRHASENNLLRLAEKFRMLIARHHFEGPLNLTITVSIGAAIARADEHFDTVLKRADIALYRAKKTRNSCVYEK